MIKRNQLSLIMCLIMIISLFVFPNDSFAYMNKRSEYPTIEWVKRSEQEIKYSTIVFDGSQFVTIHKNIPHTSTDGVHWNKVTTTLEHKKESYTYSNIHKIYYVNGHYYWWNYYGLAYMSKNLTDWVSIDFGNESIVLGDIIYINGQFVTYSHYTNNDKATGERVETNCIFTSKDGVIFNN